MNYNHAPGNAYALNAITSGGSPSPVGQPKASFTMQEIQTPRIGRKFGVKDRRPLDPPAVVQLYIHHAYPHAILKVQDYATIDCTGFICIVELFAAQDAIAAVRSEGAYEPKSLGPDVLIGSTCVEARLIHYAGQTILVFAFPDLSSKLTGDFVLRYKFLNMNPSTPPASPVFGNLYASRSPPSGPVIEGRCWGGRFTVHQSKVAPSLEVSTPLTLALHNAGMKVHIRETKRKRRSEA